MTDKNNCPFCSRELIQDPDPFTCKGCQCSWKFRDYSSSRWGNHNTFRYDIDDSEILSVEVNFALNATTICKAIYSYGSNQEKLIFDVIPALSIGRTFDLYDEVERNQCLKIARKVANNIGMI